MGLRNALELRGFAGQCVRVNGICDNKKLTSQNNRLGLEIFDRESTMCTFIYVVRKSNFRPTICLRKR